MGSLFRSRCDPVDEGHDWVAKTMFVLWLTFFLALIGVAVYVAVTA